LPRHVDGDLCVSGRNVLSSRRSRKQTLCWRERMVRYVSRSVEGEERMSKHFHAEAKRKGRGSALGQAECLDITVSRP
jgi:hypothetical protein